jgi:filamentous hemagglutinin family protein
LRGGKSFFWRRRALLAGTGAGAILASSMITPAFPDPAFNLSPAGLTQAASQRAARAAAARAQGPLINPASQAQQALSAANLARAAQAITNMQAAQAAATAADQLTLNGLKLSGQLSGSSWDGTALSGLNPVDDTDPALWIGADPLQKDVPNKVATVKQTAPNALLTWQSFDIDVGETLRFDQQADWTVLNRVTAGPRGPDGSRFIAAPSQILGKIEAPGTVYVINPNGIVFGGRSQVNVHSLIASALDVGLPTMTLAERNGFFLNTGISGLVGGHVPLTSFSYNQDDTVVEGDIKVEAGATITANLAPRSVSPDAGGFVYLFGSNVENDGTINTPAGETLMVAAQGVQLTPNAYYDGGIPAPGAGLTSATFRAVGVNTTLNDTVNNPLPGSNYPWRVDGPAGAHIGAPGEVVNTGMINAERGVVILNGDIVRNGVLRDDSENVLQAGVIRADTSVTRNGQIFLDARLQLNLDEGTSIVILPDDNGETLPLSALGNFSPGFIEMRGHGVDLEPGALVEAPGADVKVTSTNTFTPATYPVEAQAAATDAFGALAGIYMAPESTIDVSGLGGVLLPISANLVTFQPFGNEFADSPLQRDGALRGQSLTVDIRESGTFDGNPWIGTPLADVTGLAANVQRGIAALLTTGGTVNLSAPQAGAIVLRKSSTINVSGGYIEYQDGVVQTTQLLTADGRIVDIAEASPLDTYVGVAGVSVLEHPHWGPATTETFVNPLLAGGQFEAGYIEGRDAGGITLNALTYVLDGSFYAGVVAGQRQRALGQLPDPTKANTRRANPNAMPSAGFLTLGGLTNFTIQSQIAALDDNFVAGDPLPADRVATTFLSADVLTQGGFGRVSARFSGDLLVTEDADLQVADGGAITLVGGSADIEGRLTAHSGAISVESLALVAGDTPSDKVSGSFHPDGPDNPHRFDLVIGANAVLDASGEWVNDAAATPDELVGGAYVNAGSITLKTDTRSAQCVTAACTSLPGLGTAAWVDTTGSIILSEGSRLDVSSGGRITVAGTFQRDSKGRPVGKGGSVALLTYNGVWSPGVGGVAPPTTAMPSANVVFAGSDGSAAANAQAIADRISAFGFSGGGALAIGAPTINIGDASPAAPGNFNLPADFFAGNAFSAYNLSSVVGGITIAQGATVALSQRNIIGDADVFGGLATGGRPSQVGAIDFLPDIQRVPVDLQLAASLPLVPSAPYSPTLTPPPPRTVIGIGPGTVIQGDPGAAIGITVAGRAQFISTPGDQSPVGNIPQTTAVADIEGQIIAHGGAINLAATHDAEIFLGAQSLLDVSGVAVADALQPQINAGTVLAGGKVSISANDPSDSTSLVGLDGAMIDVSGASHIFDLPAAGFLGGLPVVTFDPALVWSDAGSILISGTTLLYDGGFRTAPGASQANGGSLTVVAFSTTSQAGTLTVRETGGVTAGLTPGAPLGSLGGTAFFFADALAGSGITNLTLSAGLTTSADAKSGGDFVPGTIVFDGSSGNIGIGATDLRDATIHDLAGLILQAASIKLINAGSPGGLTPAPTNTPSQVAELFPGNPGLAPEACTANVCLNANYVALLGESSSPPSQFFSGSAGVGSLRVAGNTIDIAAGGQAGLPGVIALLGDTANDNTGGIAQAYFVSTGDIRLRVPLSTVPSSLNAVPTPSGELIAKGDLTFQAAQIYPVSGVDFTLKSVGADSTIRFLANGAPAAPAYSAGARLTVSAPHIDQQGTVLAPLGTIRLGAQELADLSPNDPTRLLIAPTTSVTLGDGSVTSVSLAGLIVPFGETVNGKDWSYNSQAGLPLSAPPAKNIFIAGGSVDVAANATLDVSGGGDIQAMEFVKGTGGSRDVLANDPNVFAIIPGYNPAAAPVDLDFLFVQGDALPAAGASVFLSGGGGLPAGYYTLLPAHYATLPGAYRVKLLPNSQDALASQNAILPDGSAQMAGYLANPAAGTRGSRTIAFKIQSSDVWRQYSEIDQTSGNAFFAGQRSGAPPRLPNDAGHIAFSALSNLNLAGILLDTPVFDGRGSLVDIAARDLQVLSPGGTPVSGYVGLDAAQLTALGANSLLLGGIRSDASDGEVISLVAHTVELSNDASAPLEAPEVILVTGVHQASDGPDPGPQRGIRLDTGSVIRAKGEVATGNASNVRMGDDAKDIRGTGALLSVSTGTPLVVTRQNAKNGGQITINDGAVIDGGNALNLDSTGAIRIDPTAQFTAANISVGARSITFGDAPGSAGFQVTSPSVLSQLEQANALTLRAIDAINFFGGPSIAMAQAAGKIVFDAGALVALDGGAASINAGTVSFVNSRAAADPLAGGTATLRVDAGEIVFGAGDKKLGGFGAATFAGSNQIASRDTGSFDAGAADITFETPRFLVGSASDQSFETTTGAVAFTAAGPGPLAAAADAGTPEIGGILAVNAGSIAADTLIQATAGGVALHAAAGDIVLGANAEILANGFVQTFYDVTRAAGGGEVRLVADGGNIKADAAARIDVSSAVGDLGHAGTIVLAAAKGTIGSGDSAFDPAVIAGSLAGDSGGTLKIDAQGLGTTSLDVPSLFTDTVRVRIRQGDLATGADFAANTVGLTVDNGVLTVDTAIDASGPKGGTISLFGGQGVTLGASGRLLATASDGEERGGDIVIGTYVAADNGSASDGIIDLGTGGVIDVSNTANAANGGTVRLRAPLTPSGDDVAVNQVNASIVGAASVTVEGFKVFDTQNSAFNGVIDPIAQPGFYGSCNAAAVCTGTLIEFVQDFALSAASRQKFASIVDSLGSGTLHLQPGIELVNDDPNGGDITVAHAWNLGAGTAGFLVNPTAFTIKNNKTTTVVPAGTVITDQYGQLLPQYASYKGDLVFQAGVSQITTLFYRVGGSPTGEPGTLTLRASGDLTIGASISDGFFQTRNRIDPQYLKALQAWLTKVGNEGDFSVNVSNSGGMLLAGATYPDAVDADGNPLGPPPLAPYDPAANGISPVSTSQDKAPFAGADLFPLIADIDGPIVDSQGNKFRAIDSWSYNLVGGADTASADPLALSPLANFADGSSAALAGHGNVVIDGADAFGLTNVNSDGGTFHFAVPTMVRTGTGSIDIAAGRDFILANTDAPGVVYTAGRNDVTLPDPHFTLQDIPDPFTPGFTIKVPVAADPTGFLTPQVLSCNPAEGLGCMPYGPITAAAYPVDGGHLTLTAQQDVLGFEHPTIRNPGGDTPQTPYQQYYAPWLYAQSSALSVTAFGVFAPLSGYLSSGGDGAPYTPAQTSWWINFGSFDQGLMSVGGDVRVEAGRDIRELGVSLPTTARVSGGLSNTITDEHGDVVSNIPVMHLNKSGDLTVIAGRDILSGAYYEGSGTGRITAGRSVKAGWQSADGDAVSAVLAVDTGSIALASRASLDIAGVVSAVSMRNVADSATQSPGLNISGYGPDSKVTLQSVSGDIVVNSLRRGVALIDSAAADANFTNTDDYRGVNAYPGSFEAAALLGDVRIADTVSLAPSDAGALDLMAYDSIRTFGHLGGDTALSRAAFVGNGPSLVERTFDPARPLAGFGPQPGSRVTDLGPLLLHQGDPNPVHAYAVTGDIVSGPGVAGNSPVDPRAVPLSLELTKPSVVRSGRDIVDLAFFGQNLQGSDVTRIAAARDIFYTGVWQTAVPRLLLGGSRPPAENSGGLSLAGPGFFDIEAGRNIGPFVTSAGNVFLANNGFFTADDAAGTGIVTFGNTAVVGNRLIADDQFKTGANFLLPREGADIVALFGVGKDIDYQAVIHRYIDPATSTSPRNYLPELVAFLQTIGLPAQSTSEAWDTFNTLPEALQHVFVDKVFFSELRIAGEAKQFADGYAIIDALFPAAFGYTDNGPNGAGPAQEVATGDLEMLHATIKTLQGTTKTVELADGTTADVPVGGDIMLMGPGGSINVGATAAEPNRRLTNSAVGILTLDNGAIGTFTDGSVLVNQSRILTVQGGDVLMWSSNHDLDAGRGAKTTVDFKPLSVIFSPQELQTLNLFGLVSGAGIGTIQSTPDAPPASAFLFAPRGVVNAGDAGLRSSGNLSIAALQVLNAANIAVGGSVSGVAQVTSVNLGSLESAGQTAGQATKAAEQGAAAAAARSRQATGPKRLPSIITVEVLGFGDCDPESDKSCN